MSGEPSERCELDGGEFCGCEFEGDWFCGGVFWDGEFGCACELGCGCELGAVWPGLGAGPVCIGGGGEPLPGGEPIG